MVSTIEEDSPAACAEAGLNIAPAVADHETRIKVDPASLRGVDEHSGLGLAACASVRVVVRTNDDLVEGKRHEQSVVNAPDGFFGLRSAGYVGLVRDDDEIEAGLPQTSACFPHAGEYLDLAHIPGRVRNAAAHDRGVQYAVPVEENCAPSHVRRRRPALPRAEPAWSPAAPPATSADSSSQDGEYGRC
jgi:hypothetical protein